MMWLPMLAPKKQEWVVANLFALAITTAATLALTSRWFCPLCFRSPLWLY
jgi:hypothetical protein